jgi:tRNA (cytidine/uridine-2'-O-)-methyltransferase
LTPFADPLKLASDALRGQETGQFGASFVNACRAAQQSWTLDQRAIYECSMRLALYQPDIAQNTGTILRLGACLGVPIDVIGPTGFDMTDRALRRAGLDYLDHVDLTRHESFTDFESMRTRRGARLVLLSAHGDCRYTDFDFETSDTLLLGRESAGVPDSVHALADARLSIPMRPGLRSLNIAVAAGIVLGEALRQTNGFPPR